MDVVILITKTFPFTHRLAYPSVLQRAGEPHRMALDIPEGLRTGIPPWKAIHQRRRRRRMLRQTVQC